MGTPLDNTWLAANPKDDATEDAQIAVAEGGVWGGRSVANFNKIKTKERIICDDNTTVAELNAFLLYIADNDVGTAEVSGRLNTDAQVLFKPTAGRTGFADDEPATKMIRGDLHLQAASAFAAPDGLMKIDGFRWGKWDGTLSANGEGNLNIGTRTTRSCFKLERTANGRFKGFRPRYALGHGVHINGDTGLNTGLTRIDSLLSQYCGTVHSGSVAYRYQTAWSRDSRTGIAGAATQREILNTTTMPPVGIDENYLYLYLDGEVHHVQSVDRVNDQVTVYPWVKTTSSEAVAATWAWGASLLDTGNDGGLLVVDQLNSFFTGIGHIGDSLYGSRIQQAIAQGCTIGTVLGGSQSRVHLSHNCSQLYNELNDVHILLASQSVREAKFESAQETRLYAIKECFLPLQANDTKAPNIGAVFQGVEISVEGGTYKGRRYKPTGQKYPTSLEVHIGKEPVNPSLHSNSFIFHLQAFDEDGSDLVGYDYETIRCYGTADSGIPTGSYTFNRPGASTINGTDGSVVFSTFTKPPIFNISYNRANDNFIVSNIAE